MTETIKVSRTAAFAPLAYEIKRFGAATRREVLELFGADVFEEAQRRRIFAVRATFVGEVVYLLHAGRKLVGTRGAYNHVRDENLVNAVGLRTVGLSLEARGLDLDLTSRKHAIVYHEDGRHILALCKHDGYDFAVVRRLYQTLIVTGQFDEVQLFTYLTRDEALALARTLYRPARQSAPLDPERLRLFVLPKHDTPPGSRDVQFEAVRLE